MLLALAAAQMNPPHVFREARWRTRKVRQLSHGFQQAAPAGSRQRRQDAGELLQQ